MATINPPSTVLFSLPVEDLQAMITNAVNTSLQKTPVSAPSKTAADFEYIPIQEIFKRKICSKPTFYEHVKKGEFSLYKFGNKSFVRAEEFSRAFHKVEFTNSAPK